MIEVLVGLVVLALLAAVFVLPLIALIRTAAIGTLGRRVADLEHEVGRLRRLVHDARPAAAPAPAGEPPLDVIPADAEPRRRRPPVRPEPEPAGVDAATLESWIGQRALGWVAVVLLLFATAFFIKYAFDNEWIGELGRVSLGALTAAGLCVGGLAAHRRGYHRGSRMLTAAGVALLYLCTFAAFGYYQLMPRDRAGVFLVVIVLEAAALAVLYDAPAIAVMAIVGGLLSPVLLHSDRDQYRALFLYLGVLNAGVVGLALLKRWSYLAPVGLVGTQALFWGWYHGRYHFEKLAPALTFQLAVYGLFLVHDVIAPALLRRRATVVQLVQLVVNAFLLCVAGYALLADDWHPWLPSLTVGVAIVYAALALLVQYRSPDDAPLQLAAVATSAAVVAVAIALRGEAAWVALGWAVEGLLLWSMGLRIRNIPLRALGGVLLVLGAGRLLVQTPWLGRPDFMLFLNNYALPGAAIAGCVLLAAFATRRLAAEPTDADRFAWWSFGLGGVLLLWLVCSVDVYQWARFRSAGPLIAGDQMRFAQLCLSVFWAVYAGTVLAVGFWRQSRPVRVTALGLFGLTLAKVILLDMAGLPGIYRVAAFFVLAVIMGAAAWGYQRIEAGLKPAR